MLFTIKRPKSERFFQLTFKGFRPQGRNKIEEFAKLWIAYFRFLFLYALKKLKALVVSSGKVVFLSQDYARAIKRLLVSKLIWSRGRLGRPVATLIIMNAAFLVFVFGKLFNSSKFVSSQEINPDYLSSTTDIIPQRNIALTTVPEDRKRSEPFVYAVLPGDTLSDIGNKFKVSTDALKYINNLSDAGYLKIGQQVVIPPVAGLVHKIEKGDTLGSIARKYGVAEQAVADFNYILDTSKLAVGTELIIPGAKVPQPVIVPAIPSSIAGAVRDDPNAQKSLCVWPTTVRILTQYFSWYHNGLDIATPLGGGMPPIYACTGGTVVRAGWDPWGLGLHVRIQHPNGYETVYGHMSRLYVSYGEEVARGETLGLMGSTGRSTGPHVHFIIKYKGTPQNPLNYMN